MEIFSSTQKDVQDYYGSKLQTTQDLQTTACALGGSGFPKHHQEIINKIHPDVLSKFYGCGSPIPSVVEGMTILDLGCGSGRDVYLASCLVGEAGKVIGIDMTPEQVEVAQKYQEYHREQFGHSKSNVEIILGTIEDLKAHNIPDNSVDIVISNCVINLVKDKEVVFKEVFRVLKEGGELFFSDMYADRRIPKALQQNKVLWGEGLSGALYVEDFRRIMERVGFHDYNVTKRRPIQINNKDAQELCGPIKYSALTISAFKLKDLEDRCEDYGQSATYKGGIQDFEESFPFDSKYTFQKGVPQRICRNIALMLSKTRYSHHFDVLDEGRHLGLFDCSGNVQEKGGCVGGVCSIDFSGDCKEEEKQGCCGKECCVSGNENFQGEKCCENCKGKECCNQKECCCSKGKDSGKKEGEMAQCCGGSSA